MPTLDDVRSGNINLAGHNSGRPSFASRTPWAAYWFYSVSPNDPQALEYYETDAATVIHKIQLEVGATMSAVGQGRLQHPDGRVTDGKVGGQTLTNIARLFTQNGLPDVAANVQAGRIDRATWEKIIAYSFYPSGHVGNVALPPNTVLPPVCNPNCTDLGVPRVNVRTYKWEGQRDAREYNAFTGGRPADPPTIVRMTMPSSANKTLWLISGLLLAAGIGVALFGGEQEENEPDIQPVPED